MTSRTVSRLVSRQSVAARVSAAGRRPERVRILAMEIPRPFLAGDSAGLVGATRSRDTVRDTRSTACATSGRYTPHEASARRAGPTPSQAMKNYRSKSYERRTRAAGLHGAIGATIVLLCAGSITNLGIVIIGAIRVLGAS